MFRVRLGVVAAALLVTACGTIAAQEPGATTPVASTTTTTIAATTTTLRIEATTSVIALVPLAVRLDPPVVAVAEPPVPSLQGQPFAPEGLSDCDEMNFYRVQWGLPSAFAGLGWRESNCRNEDGVRTWCCYGYWQLYVSLHLRDSHLADRYHECGVYSAFDVNSDNPFDKQRQACATKALYDVQGFAPWG